MSYIAKGAPFRFKGAINVEDCTTSEDVICKAGLNWDVAKCEILAKMPFDLIDDIEENEDRFIRGSNEYNIVNNAYAIYRTDINYPLGLVKERYTPVQNIYAFKFFDKAIGKNKALWQTAGAFGAGERIFVSAKLPNHIFVNGSDVVDNYLVFTNSHDGSSGVKILFTPIRVVCENTLNAAIRTSTNYVSFRHTQSVHSNLDIADEILGICKDKIAYLAEQYDFMNKIKINDNKANEIFAKVILTKNEIESITNTGHTLEQIISRNYMALNDTGISMKKANTLYAIRNYYHSGIGQKEIEGTAWGAYNAISGYYSNVDNSVGIARMDSILYGSKANKIELAGNIAIAA